MSVYQIVTDRKSDFHIVTSRYADEATRRAAEELQKYIWKSTGALLPYFSDRCPRRGAEIRVGEGARGHQSDLSALDEEGFLLFGDGEDYCITGKTGRGVLYGVFRFLEIYCGFRRFTEEVEQVKTCCSIAVDGEKIGENPAFEYREAYFRAAFGGEFSYQNRLNGSLCDLSSREGGSLKWYNFHHSFRDLVSPDLYFEEHPEYFSEVDGKRISDGQLCLSNPEVAVIAKKTLRRWATENPLCQVFSVAQNDNKRYCTCPQCRAIDREEGSPAGSIIRFVNDLTTDLLRIRPDARIHTFAYQYSLPAPAITKPLPQVIVRLCSISCRFDKPIEVLAAENPEGQEAVFLRALNDWSAICKRIYIWDYAVNFRNYLQPFFQYHVMAENLRLFWKKGVRGVLEEGNFSYGRVSSFDELKTYLTVRLLWNPDADVDALIHEFLVGVYGKAADAMAAYVEMAEKVCSSGAISIFQYPDAPYLPADYCELANPFFARAFAAETDPKIQERLRREELAIRYLSLCRLPNDSPGREEKIRAFMADVQALGLTEIMERSSLPMSQEFMLRGNATRDRDGYYSLYYIMQ